MSCHVMSIKRFLYKVKREDRVHLSDIIKVEKNYNELYSKSDDHSKDMLSLGYIGIAYDGLK